MEPEVENKRVSSRAIIIKNEKLLTFFRRIKLDNAENTIEYYSIPGGAVEKGESISETALREFKEELSVDIKLGPEVAVLNSYGAEHHFFVADIMDGTEPFFNPDSPESEQMSDSNSYEVSWLPVSDLTEDKFHWGFELLIPLIKRINDGQIPKTAEVLNKS